MLLLMNQFHSLLSTSGFYAAEYSPDHLKQTKVMLIYCKFKIKGY